MCMRLSWFVVGVALCCVCGVRFVLFCVVVFVCIRLWLCLVCFVGMWSVCDCVLDLLLLRVLLRVCVRFRCCYVSFGSWRG